MDEFKVRMRRVLDAAAMDSAADAQQYALLGVEKHLSDATTKDQLAVLLLGPVMSAFIHLAECAAERIGTDRASLLAEVRERVSNDD